MVRNHVKPFTCLAKFVFPIFGPKSSRPIRLLDSSIWYIFRTVWPFVLIFGMMVHNHKGKELRITIWHGHARACPSLPKHARACPILPKANLVDFFCYKWSMKLENDEKKRLKAFMWLIVAYSQFFGLKSSRPIRSLDSSNRYIFWTVWPFVIIFCMMVQNLNDNLHRKRPPGRPFWGVILPAYFFLPI